MIPSDAWRERALCAGMPTEVFFQAEPIGNYSVDTERPDPHAEARAVCAACPVITECLTWAIEHNEYGFLGGKTELERAALKRKGQRSRQQRDDNGRSYAITPLEDARRMAAYEQGMSDGEASQALHLHRATFRAWRIVKGLPIHKPRFISSPLPPRVEELRRSLYDSGLTDQQIAAGANCTDQAIKRWRSRRGLPVNQQRQQVTA